MLCVREGACLLLPHHLHRGDRLRAPHGFVVTAFSAWKVPLGNSCRKLSRRKSGGKTQNQSYRSALGSPILAADQTVRHYRAWTFRLAGLNVPLFSPWLLATAVKLEDSSLFGSASWRAIDDSVARVDAPGHPMNEAAPKSKQDRTQEQETPQRKGHRRSSSSALLEFSSINRVPLCWALSVVLILVSF